jgi:hypothetical protein
MRGRINQFDFHGIKASDGVIHVALRCHVCRQMLRSSDPNTQEFSHCGRVYKRDHHSKGTNFVIVESNSRRTERRLPRKLYADMQAEIQREQIQKQNAALIMGAPKTR